MADDGYAISVQVVLDYIWTDLILSFVPSVFLDCPLLSFLFVLFSLLTYFLTSSFLSFALPFFLAFVSAFLFLLFLFISFLRDGRVICRRGKLQAAEVAQDIGQRKVKAIRSLAPPATKGLQALRQQTGLCKRACRGVGALLWRAGCD